MLKNCQFCNSYLFLQKRNTWWLFLGICKFFWTYVLDGKFAKHTLLFISFPGLSLSQYTHFNAFNTYVYNIPWEMCYLHIPSTTKLIFNVLTLSYILPNLVRRVARGRSEAGNVLWRTDALFMRKQNHWIVFLQKRWNLLQSMEHGAMCYLPKWPQ